MYETFIAKLFTDEKRSLGVFASEKEAEAIGLDFYNNYVAYFSNATSFGIIVEKIS